MHIYCGIKFYTQNYQQRTPVVFFMKLMSSYYESLKTLPSNRLLVKAFKTDQYLHVKGGKLWYLCLLKNLAPAGVKDNDKNLFDFKRIDRTSTYFRMSRQLRT